MKNIFSLRCHNGDVYCWSALSLALSILLSVAVFSGRQLNNLWQLNMCRPSQLTQHQLQWVIYPASHDSNLSAWKTQGPPENGQSTSKPEAFSPAAWKFYYCSLVEIDLNSDNVLFLAIGSLCGENFITNIMHKISSTVDSLFSLYR